MATLNELIYSIWQKVNPLISDDSILDERVLKYYIHNNRALWIRNEYNRNRTLDDAVIQSLGAVELEIVDTIENTNFTGISHKILKSKLQIPVAIELHNSTAITRVASLDLKQKKFSFVDYTTVPYVGNGKFNRNQVFTFLKGGYLYIVSDCNNPAIKALKYVNVRGIFANPEEVGRFTEIDGTSCYSDNDKYPINNWMLPYIESEIMKGDLKFFYNTQIDETNNANPTDEQINK